MKQQINKKQSIAYSWEYVAEQRSSRKASKELRIQKQNRKSLWTNFGE